MPYVPRRGISVCASEVPRLGYLWGVRVKWVHPTREVPRGVCIQTENPHNPTATPKETA